LGGRGGGWRVGGGWRDKNKDGVMGVMGRVPPADPGPLLEANHVSSPSLLIFILR